MTGCKEVQKEVVYCWGILAFTREESSAFQSFTQADSGKWSDLFMYLWMIYVGESFNLKNV